jgi:hypothetical protein
MARKARVEFEGAAFTSWIPWDRCEAIFGKPHPSVPKATAT